MKKCLALILCFATVFSSVAFCFTAIAAELEFGVETGEDMTVFEPENVKALSKSLAYELPEPLIEPSVALGEAERSAENAENNAFLTSVFLMAKERKNPPICFPMQRI